MMGSKHIDPALCIYIGAYLICIDNKHLRDKVPQGNRTLCQVLGVKLKENAQSYKWKNYYGKKVWTVNADDVEWVECEHVNKTSLVAQLELQINELKHQLDLLPNDHQSKKQTIKSKLDDLNNKLAKKRLVTDPNLNLNNSHLKYLSSTTTHLQRKLPSDVK
jgi:hypothetical protein